jgi:hypothetical protein
VVVLDQAAQSDWLTFALAALNGLQTVLLAYLAADRANLRAMRKQGVGTRSTDPPPPPS